MPMMNVNPKRFWRNWKYSDKKRPAYRRVRALRRAKRGVLTPRELRMILQQVRAQEKEQK